jgi:hypothetical protein
MMRVAFGSFSFQSNVEVKVTGVQIQPQCTFMIWYDMIWYDIYLAAIGLTLGGSSTAHIYTQTVHRIQRTENT